MCSVCIVQLIIAQHDYIRAWVTGQLSGRVLVQGLQGLQSLRFKPLPRHPVVEVSSSLTSSSCCLYQHHADREPLDREQVYNRSNQQQSKCTMQAQQSCRLAGHLSGIRFLQRCSWDEHSHDVPEVGVIRAMRIVPIRKVLVTENFTARLFCFSSSQHNHLAMESLFHLYSLKNQMHLIFLAPLVTRDKTSNTSLSSLP